MKRLLTASILLVLFLNGCAKGEDGPGLEPVTMNEVVEEIKREDLKLTQINELYLEANSEQATFEVDTSKDLIAIYIFDTKKKQEQGEAKIYSKLTENYGSSLLAYSQKNFSIFLVKKNPDQYDIEYKIKEAMSRLDSGF